MFEDGRKLQPGRERRAAILVRLAGRVLRVDVGGRRAEGKAHLVREITFEPEVCAGDMAARAVGPLADIARGIFVGVPDRGIEVTADRLYHPLELDTPVGRDHSARVLVGGQRALGWGCVVPPG